MAAPGNFTTLAASGAVTFPSGAAVGYLWQCSSVGGLGGWVALPSISASGALSVSSADANITASWGGSFSTAVLAAASLSVTWSGTLPVTRGGTGISTCATGDIPYGSASNTVAMLPANGTATRKFLLSVSGGAPSWTTLIAADIASATMNFTSIGFAMAPPTNAYISTTSRTAQATGASYQVSLGGTYTGINGTTNITDLDITTTHTSGTGGIATSAAIQITPNTNATTAAITSHYALLIGTGTNSGGTVTSSYGIYNNVQTYATTNYGYYQAGTFTKASDVGMQLSNTFSPAAAVTLLSGLTLSPTYTPTGGPYTVTAFYNEYINPTISISSTGGVITTTAYYGLSIKPAAITFSGATAHVIIDLYNLYSATPAPTLASSSITRAYSGYFVNPLAGTSNVALYTDSLQVGGTVTTTTTTATVGLIRAYGLNISTFGSATLQSLVVTKGNGTALATTDVNGFVYLPAVAGAPTGTPATYDSNKNAPIVYDTTNKILHVYDFAAAAWNSSFVTSTITISYTNGGAQTVAVNVWYSKNSNRIVTMTIAGFALANSTGTVGANSPNGVPLPFRPSSDTHCAAPIVSTTNIQPGFILINAADGSISFFVGASVNPSGGNAGLNRQTTIQWLGTVNV